MSSQWVPILTGQRLGDYKLESHRGDGAFGVVFEAVNTVTGSRVALKVLAPSSHPTATTDFENEGVLLRQLNGCSGVVTYIDGGVGQIEVVAPGDIKVPLEFRYHVLALASGSLDELLLNPVSRSQLGWDERLRLWRHMIKSLKQMHHYGVVHRDLKCSNCLLLISKNETRVRFGDLGRAKDLNVPLTMPAIEYVTGRGDRRHAAPEALFFQSGTGRDDFLAADYYGLGSLLVELITGQPMTALAIGDIGGALEEGREDFRLGIRRDLSTLNLKFRNVIGSVVAQLPKSIRQDATVVLTNLCRPEPMERLALTPYRRDMKSRDKLDWILRRADIMIHRLEIELREQQRRERASA